MKALLLFPMADGQTGPAIKYAFEKLGHEIRAVDAKLQPRDSYKVADDFKPDLVFCSRTVELTEQVAQIKQKFPNAITCVWNVDTRDSINEWSHLFPLIRACDHYFVVANKLIPQWQTINPNTHWLPQGLQNEVYDKPKEITDEDRAKYACNVSFAGSNFITVPKHENRKRFLNAIKNMGINYKFWGCYGIPRVYNEEHNKMVSLSKINLAISGWFKNNKYTSVRDYKILGAGGFLLELHREGIYEIFPENILRCYASTEDLTEKVRYWLDHEKERMEIAERGYKWVHANATYTHRIKMALDYMGIQE